MKAYVRHIFEDVEAGVLPRRSNRSASTQQDGAPRPRRRRKVSGTVVDELVGEHGEGDGLLGAGVDAEIGAGPKRKRRKKLA